MKAEVIDKLADLLTVAFGLVAALAWNGAIQAMFKEVFGTSDNLAGMLTYAIIVTIIAVWVTIRIGKAAEKAHEKFVQKVEEVEPKTEQPEKGE